MLFKKKRLLTAAFIIFSSVLASAQTAVDTYHGELLISNRAKAGVIIGKSVPSTKGLIVVKHNKDIILRLPVTIREDSFGITFGVHFTGKTTTRFSIKGLTANTKIADFFYDYSGSTFGGTFSIPGPCCLPSLNGEALNVKNSKNLSLSGSPESAGWMLDLSYMHLLITYDTHLTDRVPLQNKKLSELTPVPYQKDIAEKSLISMECQSQDYKERYFINMNSLQEIQLSQFMVFTSKDYEGFKPSINENTLILYPESVNNQSFGPRIDIDLQSEKETMTANTYKGKFVYKAKKLTTSNTQDLTCLSRNSLSLNKDNFKKYYQTLWK